MTAATPGLPRLAPRECDVAIVGGGPAGSAAALGLARAGRSVVVMERSRYDGPRIGETLPPGLRPLLARLGLGESFLRDGHLASPGIASAWGGPDLDHRDFLLGVGGDGWHLDRCRFDEALAAAAEGEGAVVLRGAALRDGRLDHDGRWRIATAATDLVDGSLRARFLVDATGRSSVPSRRLGARRRLHDRLVARVAFFPLSDEGPGGDRRTLLEAVEEGWWYSAPIPGSLRVVAFLTDADLLRPAGASAADWLDAMRRTAHIAPRVGPSGPVSSPRVLAAHTSQLDPIAAPSRLAIGDAALAFDPLSGIGIAEALESGLDAAVAIHEHLAGATDATSDHARARERSFDRYREQWRAYYALEARWPDAPFWARRRGAAHP